MNKISITLNVSNVPKDKIFERVYKDKEGNEVKERLYKFDLIESKEAKFVTEGATWVMKKTHFGVDAQTKQERESKAKAVYVAEGFVFENKVDTSAIDPMTGLDLSAESPF